MTDETHTCEECGLTFFYAPALHECAHKGDPRMLAQADAMRGETWVEECMRKQAGR